jgi:hypothetical protein
MLKAKISKDETTYAQAKQNRKLKEEKTGQTGGYTF